MGKPQHLAMCKSTEKKENPHCFQDNFLSSVFFAGKAESRQATRFGILIIASSTAVKYFKELNLKTRRVEKSMP